MRRDADDKCKCGGFACCTWYTDRGKTWHRVFCTKCGRQTDPHERKEEAFEEWKRQEELYLRSESH